MVNRNATSPWPFVGMGLMISLLFPYLWSAVLVPWWAVLLLLLVWVVLFVLACRWWTPRPTWVIVPPVVATVVFFATVYAGARWLGWSA